MQLKGTIPERSSNILVRQLQFSFIHIDQTISAPITIRTLEWYHLIMSNPLPNTLFHSISQSRLREAVTKPALPGHSKFHYDPEGKTPGIWLADELKFVASDNPYGKEETGEVLDIWDKNFMREITGREDAEALEIKVQRPAIVLQVEGLSEGDLLQHPLLHNQFFFTGDIPWEKVKKFLVPAKEKESEATARKLAETLNRESGYSVSVESYDPMAFEPAFELKKESRNELNLGESAKGKLK